MTRPAWHAEAACADMGPALFYAEDADDRAQAAAICQACPVKIPCGATAVRNREPAGIWGGRTMQAWAETIAKARREENRDAQRLATETMVR